ncbi:MAG: dihydropteroate synthase [Candidatus Lokiarchaeota archaeon]|nr:dihydropteroate synthase [Candidatus Lokiarchaeota archaeon]
MEKIHVKLYDFLDIGDAFPTIIMGVLNLSPESFYKGSVYDDLILLEKTALQMVHNGAKMLDLGARSTAPWSKKISIKEELERIIPSMELTCKIIPNDVIISVDTQYREIAQQSLDIALKYKKKIIINDVSCLKTDPELLDFIVENEIPVILMTSKSVPGDLLTIEEIIKESKKTIELLSSKGYDNNKIILDPGIGHWIEEKTHEYDMKIIGNLEKLHSLKQPILVAISRKSFIGTTLNIPEPEKRLNGTLSATAIAVFKGAHIIRTHDVNNQLSEIVKMAESIRRSI